ncbi:MAG: hypothetical protein AAFR01_07270, partial [Pseudomonadota bacterium]
MSQTDPWSVKGIDNRAREAARDAARDEGMTLGEYLNRLILEEERQTMADTPATEPAPRSEKPSQSMATTALDRLTRRIESTEARSTLAITGIEQAVVGLLSRIENAEKGQESVGTHIQMMIDDLRETHEGLRDKISRLEADDSAETNLAALKSLEDALGRLASHVYEENALVSEETGAIKARLETGLSELTDKVDAVDRRIESAVRSEFASQLAGTPIAAPNTDALAEALDKKVEGIEQSVSQTLAGIQTRLTAAETNTDNALKKLETTFGSLNTRLEEVASATAGNFSPEMRQQFEERFDGLADDLRNMIATARAEMAEEIEAATVSVDQTVIEQIQKSVSEMGHRVEAAEAMQAETMDMVSETVSRVTESVDQRLTASQAQQARAIEQVGDNVTRIGDGLDQRIAKVEALATPEAVRDEMQRFTDAIDARLEQLETRDTDAIERVSAQVESLADKFDERVRATEERSAEAIEQVGEQVSTVARRLESRQDEALRSFSENFEVSQRRQETRLSAALTNVSDRLEQMQRQSADAISPVQRAIAALATRIEAIEDFTTPPYAERADTPAIPDFAPLGQVDVGRSAIDPIARAGLSDTPPVDSAAAVPEADDAVAEEPFEAGFEDWADDANTILDEALKTAEKPADLSHSLDVLDAL